MHRGPREISLLLSSAGRRVQLMECFRSDAVRLGVGLKIIAVDSNPALSPACHLAERAYSVPRCNDSGFVGRLLELCRQHRIDLLVPTIDPELDVLSRAASRFAAIGTRVAVSAPSVVELARDKLRTVKYLAAHGLEVPWTVDAAQLGPEPPRPFRPMILKPRAGSSSQGLRRITRAEDWPPVPDDAALAGYIAQDLLEGEEYTVNLFFDAAGRLRTAVPHQRIEVRGGEVAKGIIQRQPRLLELAAALGPILPGARGALCFQAIVRDPRTAAIFELNARFGGGFPLAHRAGARFSQWLLEEAIGISSSADDAWQDGVLMLRYDAAVFVECEHAQPQERSGAHGSRLGTS